MINAHPMNLMVDYLRGAETGRPIGNQERFPELEFAALQAKSRPNALVRWWRARQEAKKHIEFLTMLSNLSPHMLSDIGIKWTAPDAYEPIVEPTPTVGADPSTITPDDHQAAQVQLPKIDMMGRAA